MSLMHAFYKFLLSLIWCFASSVCWGATYSNVAVPFAWIDSATHTKVGFKTVPYKFNGASGCGTVPPTLDDTLSDNIPIGFDFTFGGVQFSQVRIMSNGRLQFGNTTCGFGSPVTQLPYPNSTLDYTMRIYGNDLDPTAKSEVPSYKTTCLDRTSCYVSFASLGSAPNHVFVVTWSNVPEWAAGGSTSGNYNLQAILQEDGTFIYQYGNNTPGPGNTTAQVGWQVNHTNDFDVPLIGFPASNTAIKFFIPKPTAEYRLDELGWSGTAGEVTDASGNALHGVAKLGAQSSPAKICNGVNLFNGAGQSGQYLEVAHNALLSATSALTVTAWLKPNRWGGTSGKDALMSFMSKDENYEAHIDQNGKIFWWWSYGNFRSTASVPVGQWSHVALVFASGLQTIYINGVASGIHTWTGNLANNTDPFQIGDDQLFGGGSRRFDGQIDEVKIFKATLTAAQVASGYANENAGKNWDGSARVCPVTAPHHLEITHPSGSGLTCAASTVTVRACADAACTTPYTGGVSGTLTATGTPTVNWDSTTGGATGADFVMAAGSSSVTKNLQLASTGSVVLGITSPSPVPTNATSCNFGAPSCTFVANSAGFIFSNTSTGAAYTIPPQVSGIPSASLYLRALQSSTTNPAVCTPTIVGQTTSVNLGYSCNNPTICQSGSLATVNTTAVASGSAPVSLTFDSNGSAPITLRYDDVGQITFNASKTVTPFGGSTPVNLTGSSNALVVAPHHFGFSGVTTGLIKAGTPFGATVTAYNGLATPTATANFGKEAAPESATISFVRYQPTGTGAVNGSFSGSVGAFSAGAASATNLVWSEVGTLDLTAALASGSYLGSGLTASGSTGSAGAVGPFIPDHFDVVVPQACVAGGFTYSGQAVTATLTAMNGATPPAKTLNYDGSATTSPNFAKALTLSDANGLALGAFSPSTLASSTFTAGVATPSITYTFSNPLTAPQTIAVRAVDADAVSSSGFAEGTIAVRTGRLRLQNAFGSDRLPLSVPVQAQYWDGSYFVPNSADSCTALAVPPVQTLATGVSPSGAAALYFYPVVTGKNQLQSGDTTASLASPLVGGKSQLMFTAPQRSGWLDAVLQVPDYLRGNWGNCSGQTGAAGLYDDLPCARATFGVFKSPLIYRRENY